MKWKQSIWCRQNSYRRCHPLIYQEKGTCKVIKLEGDGIKPYFWNHKRRTIPLFPFLSHNIYLGKQKDVNFGCHKKEPTRKLRKGAISGMNFYGNYKWAQRLCGCVCVSNSIEHSFRSCGSLQFMSVSGPKPVQQHTQQVQPANVPVSIFVPLVGKCCSPCFVLISKR